MAWLSSPFAWMAFFNAVTGAFSALAGVRKATDSSNAAITQELSTANPWLYVVGGLLTIGIGIGNWYQLVPATYATVLMIVASGYNAWFGAASKDWRFWTLNAYVLVLTSLVVCTLNRS